jgi:hypothetical protein
VVSADLFEELEQALAQRLAPSGYAQSARQINGAFGSHFAQFQNDVIAYRLVWDGRENWLLLECGVVVGSEIRNWRELALQRFTSLATSERNVMAAWQAMNASLEGA